MNEHPDQWCVIKIINRDNEKTFYKIFASYRGGALVGQDSWRLNSGIVRVEEDEVWFEFYGRSGSCYICKKNNYGVTVFGGYTIESIIKRAKAAGIADIEILSENTDWKNLKYE